MGLLMNLFIVSTFVAVLNCAPAEDASTLATTKQSPVLIATQQKIKDTSSASKESQESQEDRKTRDVDSQQAPIGQKPGLTLTKATIDGSSSTEDDKSKEQKPLIHPAAPVSSRQRRDEPKIQVPGGQKTKDNPKIVPVPAPAPVAARPSRDVPQTTPQKTKDNPKIQTLPAKIQRPARDTPKTRDNPKIQPLPLPVKKN